MRPGDGPRAGRKPRNNAPTGKKGKDMIKKICPTLYKTANMTFVGSKVIDGQRTGVYECTLCGSHHTPDQIAEAKARLAKNV